MDHLPCVPTDTYIRTFRGYKCVRRDKSFCVHCLFVILIHALRTPEFPHS